ncbi:hypothetical protein [Kitasatospora sp. GP82]|uniref:hypothetical protein n=1 Tax=Kitasatospora sp. GP82 TaxID=3035089 RepID=UPI002474550C|nr:hypothetical protein [Kitasatospora sp. GP82]MDH6129819.1 hypothetical protein [Kitasatospora sp. GP82]
MPRGAIIGTAQLVGCHRASGDCCPECGFPDWHWELAEVQALAAPAAAKGALGLWILPGEEVLFAVLDRRRAHLPRV